MREEVCMRMTVLRKKYYALVLLLILSSIPGSLDAQTSSNQENPFSSAASGQNSTSVPQPTDLSQQNTPYPGARTLNQPDQTNGRNGLQGEHKWHVARA